MNKFILIALFSVILFSSIAFAESCNFCNVKDINCPTTVTAGETFNISFEYMGTGPSYPYQYVSVFVDDKISTCDEKNTKACQWNDNILTFIAPSKSGTYTYTVKCYAGDSSNGNYCGMEDDSASCIVNVVGSNKIGSSYLIVSTCDSSCYSTCVGICGQDQEPDSCTPMLGSCGCTCKEKSSGTTGGTGGTGGGGGSGGTTSSGPGDYYDCSSCVGAGYVWCNSQSICVRDFSATECNPRSFDSTCMTPHYCPNGCDNCYTCDTTQGRCIFDKTRADDPGCNCYSPCKWITDNSGKKICDCSTGGVSTNGGTTIDCKFKYCEAKNTQTCTCGSKSETGYCCEADEDDKGKGVFYSDKYCLGSEYCKREEPTDPTKTLPSCNQCQINNEIPCDCGNSGLKINNKKQYCCPGSGTIYGSWADCYSDSQCGGGFSSETPLEQCENPSCQGKVTNYPCLCGKTKITSSGQFCCVYADYPFTSQDECKKPAGCGTDEPFSCFFLSCPSKNQQCGVWRACEPCPNNKLNCDKMMSCETDSLTDNNNCGDCSVNNDHKCAADEECVAGNCVNITNIKKCDVGKGGKDCPDPKYQECVNGFCQNCRSGFGNCDGTGCKDLSQNDQYCGKCDNDCRTNPDLKCIGGSCVFTSISQGGVACDPSPYNPDPTKTCGQDMMCDSKTKVCVKCPAGTMNCDMKGECESKGTCSITKDEKGNICNSLNPCSEKFKCVNGQCVPCPSGKADCDHFGDCEIFTSSDPENCGKCKNKCTEEETCNKGQCIEGTSTDKQEKCSFSTYNNKNPMDKYCDRGTWKECFQQPGCEKGNCQNCNKIGYCENLLKDPDNCNSCGTKCDGSACVNGKCAGETNVQGKCTGKNNDECSSEDQICVNGKCVSCQFGLKNCDKKGSICENLLTNSNNCGTTCGNAVKCGSGTACKDGKCIGIDCSKKADLCNTDQYCDAGICRACPSGFQNCDKDKSCASKIDGEHCGKCKNKCGEKETCAAAIGGEPKCESTPSDAKKCGNAVCSADQWCIDAPYDPYNPFTDLTNRKCTACDSGTLNCNGDNDWPKACEIKIDDKNCGTCGNDCTKENKVCNGRTCVDKSSSSSSSQLKCSVGWGSCNNKNKCDTNLVSNDHCGDCTTKCDTTNGKEYCEMSNTKEIKCVARTTEKCFQPLASANDPVIASVDSDKSEDLKVDQVTVFPTTQIENANVIISESSQPEGSESPGLVYKYLSIEVSFGVESKVESSSDSGTSSSLSAAIVPITPLYAYKEISTDTPTDKISNIEINFKVEKSWLIDNNREWSDVVLNHYENGEWIKLKTTTLTEDATYYYFSADSTSASPFAITVGENKDTCPYECCMNEAEYTDKLCDTGYICEDNICTEIVTSTETAVQQPMNFTTLITIVGGIAVIALVIIYFILKKKQKPAKSMEELRAKYRKR